MYVILKWKIRIQNPETIASIQLIIASSYLLHLIQDFQYFHRATRTNTNANKKKNGETQNRKTTVRKLVVTSCGKPLNTSGLK